MPKYALDITVNLKTGREVDLEIEGRGALKDIGLMIDVALSAHKIKEGAWSSLAVAIVDLTPKPSRRKLELVRP